MRRSQALMGKSLDSVGNVQLQGALGYSVPYVASTLDLVTAVGAPCDAVQVDTDDYSVIYASPDGADTYPGQRVDATAPSAIGAGWTDNGDGTYTHTPGSTNSIDWTGVLTIGALVLVKFTVSGRTAGQASVLAGTTAGTPLAANGSLRELLTVAGNQTFSMVPDATFDGTVSLMEVLPRSPKYKAGLSNPLRASRIEAVLDASGAEAATTVIHLGWYRKP